MRRQRPTHRTVSASRVSPLRLRKEGRTRVACSRRLRVEGLEERTLLSSAGDPDPTFGVNGKVTTPFVWTHNEDTPWRLAVSPTDGWIVAAGQTQDASGKTAFALARYSPSGSLDSNFGAGGKVTNDFGLVGASAGAVAIDDSGKIIVAGQASVNSTDDVFALARYNPDGTLDSTFGAAGQVTTSFGAGAECIEDILIDKSGRIVAVGWAEDRGAGKDSVFALARYQPDGSLDSTFGVGGKVTTSFSGYYADSALAAALDGDGKVVVAGESESSSTDVCSLARYNTDGSLDSTFGTGGKVNSSLGSGYYTYSLANAIAIDGSGRIVVGGAAYRDGTIVDFALARYRSEGTLDPAFGADGVVLTDFARSGSSGVDEITGIAIDSEG
jgi:uncharacterized delta-60 repeat protein